MKIKKSVLKILSANYECFRVSAGIAPNTHIDVIQFFEPTYHYDNQSNI